MIVKHVDPTLKLSKSLAIVGSSDNIGQSGVAIDAFDDVMRFNRAPTVGFEEHVGSKTTIRLVNNHVFRNVKFDRWKEDDNFVRNLRDSVILVTSTEPGLYKQTNHTHPSNTVYGIIPSWNAEAKRRFPQLFSGHTFPSVGLTGIILAVLSGIKPHVFGWSTNPDDPLTHYYNTRRPSGGGYHRFKLEIEALNSLAVDGIVIIH